ncbi:hypothetical protein [Agrobacterium sp. lyk4-40-TYG-31]|uniref:hypothetical protein n=1 Tax=Agrobacterium sp. lyk4-40-TYG-31 TaxID=3040276 RepID=UPI000DD87B68|nr:hypothetical protein [Agrobacterium sp. lyk4-40-TYG-31]
MQKTIYVIDESTGRIIALEPGRYRLVRNDSANLYDALEDADWRIPKADALVRHPESTDLGHVHFGTAA